MRLIGTENQLLDFISIIFRKKKRTGMRRIHLPMNTETTINSLENYLIPFLDETEMKFGKVIMDGARCHTCRKTRNFLDDANINYIPSGGWLTDEKNGYPPNSPDLNPIENVFGYWQAKICERNPQGIKQLIRICKQEWNAIPLKIIRNSTRRLSKSYELGL